MFDNYTHRSESPVLHVSKETVIEKTITPDKVTEMYDSIREEVENNFVKAFVVSSNIFDGAGVIFRKDYADVSYEFVGQYNLNGTAYTVRKKIGLEVFESGKYDFVFEVLFDHYKENLASQLIQETVSVLQTQHDKKVGNTHNWAKS